MTELQCHALAIWDHIHTVLPVTRHKWTHAALTPAMQAGARFIYPTGIEGWVDLVDLIASRPGVAPATFRSRVQRSTTAPPRQAIIVSFVVRYLTVNKAVYKWPRVQTCPCRTAGQTARCPSERRLTATLVEAHSRVYHPRSLLHCDASSVTIITRQYCSSTHQQLNHINSQSINQSEFFNAAKIAM